ncbi:helix-turn-helix domain-containing protein [Clostridium merdae]|uniref:helix-turn-helix domain-containing protein n=1 Tax=Clostridium merdae TaxID=1958780 RepID=UPI0013565FBF|nr:helix-turn-helix transcriptional regulator [Clostridium merdae]
MGIGKRIKEAREKLGLTQKELGDLLGVTGSAVTNYENEVSHPKEPIMYKMFEALQVDANYLFQDTMPENENSPAPANAETGELDKQEQTLIQNYRALNDEGKEKLLDYSDDLVSSSKYTKNNQSQVSQEA